MESVAVVRSHAQLGVRKLLLSPTGTIWSAELRQGTADLRLSNLALDQNRLAKFEKESFLPAGGVVLPLLHLRLETPNALCRSCLRASSLTTQWRSFG